MKISPLKFLPGTLWFALIVWLLTIPGSQIPHENWFDLLQVDKWVHIFLFLVLCLLFMYPFKKSQFDKEVKLPWFLLITITAIAFGAIMEFVQRDFVANRSFDIWDILADSVGSVAGFIVARKRL